MYTHIWAPLLHKLLNHPVVMNVSPKVYTSMVISSPGLPGPDSIAEGNPVFVGTDTLWYFNIAIENHHC